MRTIADLRPVAYGGTPSFLKILLDRAAERQSDIAALTKGLVGAEAFPSLAAACTATPSAYQSSAQTYLTA